MLEDLAAPLHKRPMTAITAAEILEVLKRVEKSGRREPANPEQSKQFIEIANDVGMDPDEGALERAIKKIAPSRKTSVPPARAVKGE
jgi:hypothetical protein